MSAIIQGSGGGGSKAPRAPVEAPDSLKSTAFARIVDLITEGPAYGPVNGLQSLFFDETPLQNPDGTFNFKNVQVDTRLGSLDQPYIPGYTQVENEIGVNVELEFGTHFVRNITNAQLSAISVRLSVPLISKTDSTTGDISGYSIQYAIDIATNGGSYVEVFNGAITGKSSSKYERSHRLNLPTGTAWSFRVRRLTPNANSAAIQDITIVESYTEIIDAKLRYPGSALCATTLDASQFSNIPRRANHWRGVFMKIPSNYNPETRVYTGVWDGTFNYAYSNNPAWAYYLLATNTRFGLGHIVKESDVDKWELYKIGRYCDELVPDGFGGTEPRFTCNVYLQERADAHRVMQDLASIFRGMSYWSNGVITAIADQPADPSYTYTNANVKNNKFSYSGSGRRARHTVALVSWIDMSDFGRGRVEYVPDRQGIARYGVNEVQTVAFGCTSRGQAHRAGLWMLTSERLETDTCTWGVGLDGTLSVPGQIVRVADSLRAGRRIGGRVATIVAGGVTVDALPVPAPSAGDTLTCILPTGFAETRTISSVDVGTKTILVTGGFSASPVPESVWTVETNELVAQQYKIIAVSETGEGEEIGYTMTGLEHQPGKYDFVDFGVQLEPLPTTRMPDGKQAPVSNIVLSVMERATHVVASCVIEGEWDAPPGAVRYEVSWRSESGAWSPPQEVTETYTRFENAFPGGYRLMVTAISANGTYSIPVVSSTLEVPDLSIVPGVIDEIIDSVIDFEAAFDDIEAVNLAQDAALAQAEIDIANETIARINADLAEAGLRADGDTSLQASIDTLTSTLAGKAEASALNALITRVDDAEGQIAANSSAITTLNAAIGAGFNSVSDPSFEGDGTGWASLPSGWSVATDTGVERTGKRILVISGAQPSPIVNNNATFPCFSGDEFNIGFYCGAFGTAPVGGYLRLAVRWYDADGVQLSVGGTNATISPSASRWTKVAGTMTAPADAVSGRIGIQCSMTSGNWCVDDVWVENLSEAEQVSATAITALDVRVTSTETTNTAQGTAITQLNTDIAGKASTTAVNLLTTRVSDAENEIDAQSSAITLVQAGIAQGGSSGNLLPNADMMSGASGWAIGGTWGTSQVAPNLPNTSWTIPGTYNLVVYENGTPLTTVYRDIATKPENRPVCVPGRKYIASVYVGNHRARAQIFMQFINAAGSAIVSPSTVLAAHGYSPTLGGATRLQIVFTAPADACTINFIMRSYTVNPAEFAPYVWWTMPMVEEVPASQTAASGWSPGGRAYAQATTNLTTSVNSLTGSFNATYTMTLDVNNYVTGWKFNNNGTTGDLTIVADRFRIVTPGFAARTPFAVAANGVYINTDLFMGNGRIISVAGGYMKVQGTGFGSSNQFVEWWGPYSANLATCTEANAIYYLKTNGSAYFGGTLSAGVLKNAAQSSQISATASVETGAFGTNGNAKTVVYSFTYSNRGFHTTNLGSATLAATATLQRSYNGGAWTNVSTLVMSGNRTNEGFESGLGYDMWSRISGSSTFTDNTAGTGTFNYRVLLSGASNWPITYNVTNSADPQRLSVISTEQ